jgi:hypothetical protein
VIRIDDDTMNLQRETDVIHIMAAAGEELPVFDAREGLAEFCTAHRYGMVSRLGAELDEFGAVGNGSMTYRHRLGSVDHLLTPREA